MTIAETPGTPMCFHHRLLQDPWAPALAVVRPPPTDRMAYGAQSATVLSQWYPGGIEVKTSVTLSEALLSAMSADTEQSNRSAFIEEATWRYLRQRRREARDRSELVRINEHADELNEEAFDVLEFQADE